MALGLLVVFQKSGFACELISPWGFRNNEFVATCILIFTNNEQDKYRQVLQTSRAEICSSLSSLEMLILGGF